MIRGRKDVDWTQHLDEEARGWVGAAIDPLAWYPMEVFEQLGNAILDVVGAGEVELVRLWGQQSVEPLIEKNPLLLEPQNPVETLNRFRVLRSTYFNFDALQVPLLLDDEAEVVIDYGMGNKAEEAAAYQTLGFFEGLLDKASATSVQATFVSKRWAGDEKTLLTLRWNPPA